MITDQELIKKTLDGNLSSFEVLVKRYHKRIYYHCLKILKDHDKADDASQETFIRVYKNLAKFKLDKQFSPWIYKIATNLVYDMIRKESRKVSLDWEVQDDRESTINKLIRNEQVVKVKNLLNDLPDKYQKPLVAYYYEEKL